MVRRLKATRGPQISPVAYRCGMNHRETLVGQLDGECHRGNTQHTGSDASPGVQSLIYHQVGTRLLERRQQGSGHGLRDDISEEPDHEIEST